MTIAAETYSQTVLPLYRDSIPNAREVADEEKWDTAADGIVRISKVSRPTLTVYFPPKDKATGAAVVVCPGGGYRILAVSHEGHDVAKRFNEMGVAAFVLKYRIPDDQTMVNKEIGPLQDAQRAIQLVRENAKKWRIDENKIGIMGFSAGGHLASTAGTHLNQPYIENNKNISLRPDYMVGLRLYNPVSLNILIVLVDFTREAGRSTRGSYAAIVIQIITATVIAAIAPSEPCH